MEQIVIMKKEEIQELPSFTQLFYTSQNSIYGGTLYLM